MPHDDPLERRLLGLTPAPSSARRDALMFEAGRRTERRNVRLWKAACGLLVLGQSAALVSIARPSGEPARTPEVVEIRPVTPAPVEQPPATDNFVVIAPRHDLLTPLDRELPPLVAASAPQIDERKPLRAGGGLPRY